MKALSIFLLILGSAGNCWAQGYIAFYNRILVPPNVIDAPVFDTDCRTRLEGPFFVSQVYAGLKPGSLEPIGPVIPFLSGPGAGYMDQGVAVAIPGAIQGTVVYTQLRAWDSRTGATFDAASAAGGIYGFSNIVPIAAVMAPGSPNNAVGLQSFCLVPEASEFSVLFCAMVALGLRFRLFHHSAFPRHSTRG